MNISNFYLAAMPPIDSFRRAVIAAFVAMTVWAPAPAQAQCANPHAESGVLIFNVDHKVMQYCNGEKWVGMGGGGGGSGLPACANGEIAQFSGGAWTCNNGSGIGNLNASNLTSGTVPRARLGSGTANSTTFLRGDGTWAAPSGGGGSNCSASSPSLQRLILSDTCGNITVTSGAANHSCPATVHGAVATCTVSGITSWAMCLNGAFVQTGTMPRYIMNMCYTGP